MMGDIGWRLGAESAPHGESKVELSRGSLAAAGAPGVWTRLTQPAPLPSLGGTHNTPTETVVGLPEALSRTRVLVVSSGVVVYEVPRFGLAVDVLAPVITQLPALRVVVHLPQVHHLRTVPLLPKVRLSNPIPHPPSHTPYIAKP